VSTYNNLISLDETVQTQWGNVQTNYQRRADLYASQLPIVVAGAAQELAVFKELRKQAEGLRTSLNYTSAPTGSDAEKLAGQIATFDTAVLSFNAYVADNPEIVSVDLYRDFMVLVEGTENRINVARRDYNNSVRAFRTKVRTFPANLVAPIAGLNADMYVYFEAQSNAQGVPELVFPTTAP